MRSIDTVERETNATIARVRGAIDDIRQAARRDGRAETAEERADIEGLIGEATHAKATLDRRRSDDSMSEQILGLTNGRVPANIHAAALPSRGTYTGGTPTLFRPGRIESVGATMGRHWSEWRRSQGAALPQRWESASIEVPYEALFAGTITSDSSSGGDLIVPDFRPGILPTAFRPLVVADLIAPGTTDSNMVTYMVESAYTNAADTVAEGTVKPESTLAFDAASDPVRKIAHHLPATEEILEDVPQMQSYIDARLRLGVQLTEDDQLLNGTTTPPDIVGIRNRVGLAPEVVQGTASVPDAIATQMAAIQTTTNLPVTGLVMNPIDWLRVQLMKTATGEYVGDGPFMRPVAPTLWGVPVAVTTAMESGVVLVGAFRTAAQIFRKGGISVAWTNSHLDYWTRNLVSFRAEERLSLAVYRPGAFGEVHLAVVTP